MSVSRHDGLFMRRLAFTLLTACVIAAIVIQDHTSYLPLGVFNTGAKTIAKISDASLALAVLVLLIQLVELFRSRMTRINGVIRGLYTSLIILDVLLIFGDRVFVTGNPASKLGQYYEVPDSGHPPVIRKKAFHGNTPTPCMLPADAAPGPRILFLGDSYTEGSGSAPECNYANVAERVLRATWRPDTRVVNAGVSGYGPVEALSMLRWYRDQRCPVDAIVYNLTLQNDFADNLPGTERRVVAGIIFRFPRNVFLRTFHPLNTRMFRWVLVLVFFGRAQTQDMLNAVSVPGGPCDLELKPLTDVSPFLRATVERDLLSARRISESPAGYAEATRAIEDMRSIAREAKVPFFLVVFPDRVLADPQLHARMGIEPPMAPVRNHGFAITKFHADQVLDVYEMLEGRPGMYRAVDTHLSDAGNVAAGEFVGSGLAVFLKMRGQAPSNGAMMVR